MKVMSIVGARPQFIKLAPISWSSRGNFKHEILHTGQHYDPLLSESFFKEFSIPQPDFLLRVGSGNHGQQTARMLMQIENVLLENRPDHVILYGDTNSTLAGAVAASKLNIAISHIEAGLRSFNRSMPEEINRILTDHCSNMLFAPTQTALNNLINEGLGAKTCLSGDVMMETLNFIRSQTRLEIPSENFLIATIHRAENTNEEERVIHIISQLRKSPIPVHLYCHPRLKKILDELNLSHDYASLKIFAPLDYVSTIKKLVEASGVITDSGGLQKEAYILGKPCLIVRSESEWIETLNEGSSFLDPELMRVSEDWWSSKKTSPNQNIFGDGSASKTIVQAIKNYNSSNT